MTIDDLADKYDANDDDPEDMRWAIAYVAWGKKRLDIMERMGYDFEYLSIAGHISLSNDPKIAQIDALLAQP